MLGLFQSTSWRGLILWWISASSSWRSFGRDRGVVLSLWPP